MSYLGAYLGLGAGSAPVEEEDDGPAAIEVPIQRGSALYVDHVERALDRLPEQFKRRQT